MTDPERDDYRQLFTTVFSDYYLFDDLVQGSATQSLDSATQYLERLEIAHKVSVKDGVFSTTDLSTGQRNRPALEAWIRSRLAQKAVLEQAESAGLAPGAVGDDQQQRANKRKGRLILRHSPAVQPVRTETGVRS